MESTAAGISRGAEHYEIDQYCAGAGVFIIEKIAHLDILIRETGNKPVTLPFRLIRKGCRNFRGE
ncbi:hypothetical protein DCCM_2590 [Desulfocucumis palustris]|uniref:Uncharacterized protein n=1 Tax=Desulfocucumis palustris TaxID=1898651 RepID=A0A2L2XBB2_9FIRM|nr:hypothetical protein DCCM_2590 [Desulfocucumis palustris]